MGKKNNKIHTITAETRISLNEFKESKQSKEVKTIVKKIKEGKIHNLTQVIEKLAELEERNGNATIDKHNLKVSNTKAAIAIKEFLRLNGVDLSYIEIIKLSPLIINKCDTNKITNNRLNKFDRKLAVEFSFFISIIF